MSLLDSIRLETIEFGNATHDERVRLCRSMSILSLCKLAQCPDSTQWSREAWQTVAFNLSCKITMPPIGPR